MQTTAALGTAESGQRETSTPVALDAGGSMSRMMQSSTTNPPKFRTYPLPTSTQHMKVSNKATAIREMQKSQLMHVDKLRKMKAGIDMKPPQAYPHVRYNAKRMQVRAAPRLELPLRGLPQH